MFLKKKWKKQHSPMAKADTSGNDPRRTCTIRTLDTWHSRYIRLRDTDGNGVCRCFTCLWTGNPKDCTCGHYVKRDRYNIKYHNKNCHAQCWSCNSFQDGKAGVYAIKLNETYGSKTALSLEVMGKRSGKLSAVDRYLRCQEFKRLVKIELKRTGLEPWWKREK